MGVWGVCRVFSATDFCSELIRDPVRPRCELLTTDGARRSPVGPPSRLACLLVACDASLLSQHQTRLRVRLLALDVADWHFKLQSRRGRVAAALPLLKMRVLRVACLVAAGNAFVAARARIQAAGLHAIDAT